MARPCCLSTGPCRTLLPSDRTRGRGSEGHVRHLRSAPALPRVRPRRRRTIRSLGRPDSAGKTLPHREEKEPRSGRSRERRSHSFVVVPYFPCWRRCQRVFLSILRCFFLRIFLRRFFTSDGMLSPI